jgi:hypothetical protein
MRAGNYFTVTVSHPVLSLLAAAGEWVVFEGRTRNREYGFLCTVRGFLKQKIKQRNNAERELFRFCEDRHALFAPLTSRRIGIEKPLHEFPLPSDPRQIGIREVNVFDGSAASHLALARNCP